MTEAQTNEIIGLLKDIKRNIAAMALALKYNNKLMHELTNDVNVHFKLERIARKESSMEMEFGISSCGKREDKLPGPEPDDHKKHLKAHSKLQEAIKEEMTEEQGYEAADLF